MRSATTAKNNVLILDGSPHTDGTIARLIAALPAEDATHVRLYDTPVAPCTDCRACRVTGRCAFRDMDVLYAQLEEADVLVFATPVYNDSFPAPLKAAIDRCQVYWSRRFCLGMRPPIARRKRVFLLSAGGADTTDASALVAQLKPLLTVLNGELIGTVHVGNTDRSPDLTAAVSAVKALF
ncbi:MAG: flavodoxin family protein [Clostridia bacterium]|nr:flavodoxin family protein [Clostridia bacterium]